MRTTYQLALCLLFSLAYNLLWALPSDLEQAIHIESDSATRDDTTGITVYTGNVKIEQGGLRISADKVTVHIRNNELSHIVCVGKPAVYQQQAQEDEDLMTARADTIEYQFEKELVILKGNASVDQAGGSKLSGPEINYDLKKELLQAGGAGRVQVVIPTKEQQDSTL